MPAWLGALSAIGMLALLGLILWTIAFRDDDPLPIRIVGATFVTGFGLVMVGVLIATLGVGGATWTGPSPVLAPLFGLGIVLFFGGLGLGGVVLIAVYGRQLPLFLRVVSVSVIVIAAITLGAAVRNTLGI